MWVINIQDWLDETRTGPAVPRLRLKIKKLSEIITYATSEITEIPVGSPPNCWRRPGRKPCTGLLDIFLDPETDQIYWFCKVCGDEGALSGWEGLIWDMTDVNVGESIH